MSLRLVVTRPFAQYARGDVIDDAKRIADLLSGEHRMHVVRVIANPDATTAKEG